VRNRRKQAVVILTAAVVGGIALSLWPRRDPVYRGKSLGDYLDHLAVCSGQGGSREEDVEAFVQFGTNAIPYVRDAFRTRDTAPRRVMAWVAAKQSFIKIRIRPAAYEHCAALDAYAGILEAIDEGSGDPSAAEACAPELRVLLKDPDPTIRNRADELLHLAASVKARAESRKRAK
jgi:hypothetical protein